MDDPSTASKIRGLNSLSLFLRNTSPSALLHRTSLGSVFEDAILPSLLHLPSLTPETESLALLSAAYPALITLARVRFPEETVTAGIDHKTPKPKPKPDPTEERIRALDRVMREGILKGYAHAGEYVRVAEVLVRQIRVLLGEMGVGFVRYLKAC